MSQNASHGNIYEKETIRYLPYFVEDDGGGRNDLPRLGHVDLYRLAGFVEGHGFDDRLDLDRLLVQEIARRDIAHAPPNDAEGLGVGLDELEVTESLAADLESTKKTDEH